MRRLAGRLPPVVLVAAAASLLSPLPAAGAGPDPVGVWPLAPEPAVVTRFDPPADRWGAGHRGVDLAGTIGRVVRAALPGRVAFVGRIAGRGVVTVAHRGEAAGTRTTYEPVAGVVAAGDLVAAGQVIGHLEGLGGHCLPAVCLHWGWLRGDTYLDPLRLVGAGPIRLLPLWRDEPVWSGSSAGARVPLIDAWRPPAGLFP